MTATVGQRISDCRAYLRQRTGQILIEMIDRSRRFGAEKIILSNNHTTLRHKPLLNGRTLEEQRKTYNLIVAEVARDTGVQFCDIDAEFAGLSRRELEGELLPYPDWLHLSQSGHRRYASKILPYVASGLREIAMTRGIERVERLREGSTAMNVKSETDKHWNERARSGIDAAKVNIDDTVQRDLELQFVFKNIDRGSRLLEVGCGNGYVTRQLRERVAHVDAFDYAENMIEQGKRLYGETNNRFFHDSVLDPKNVRRALTTSPSVSAC